MDTEALEATGPYYPNWAVNQNPFLPAFDITPSYYALLRGGAAIDVGGGTRFRDNAGLSDATRGLVLFGSSRTDVAFDPSVLIDMTSGQSDDQSQVDVTDANHVSLGRDAQWQCPPGSKVVNVSSGRNAVVMPLWFPTVDRNGLSVNDVAAGTLFISFVLRVYSFLAHLFSRRRCRLRLGYKLHAAVCDVQRRYRREWRVGVRPVRA